ncbi:MAG: oligoendopeptidase F, partial [Lachnospiraceae bacterium]|nr:oligoendopeptidase F [Lachnospiraceae bacterium]
MMQNELKSRRDIPVELTWDLSLIYAAEEELYRDVERLKSLCGHMEQTYKGRLDTPERINACLDDLREVNRLLVWAVHYCDLAVSVDYYDTHNQERNEEIASVTAKITSRLSFIDNEIARQTNEVIQGAAALSEENSHYLQNVLRTKPHLLHPETERVLAALSRTIQAPYQIYNMAKLADMKFPSFQAEGKEYPLGYSLFENNYAYEENTAVRRGAFDAFSAKIKEYENVTAAAYNTQVQTEKTIATLRGFDSVFDSLLFGQRVSRELYDRQIDLITEKLAPHMRRYARLLKKIHGLDRMTFADLKIAVDPEYDPKVTIAESEAYMEKGLAVLGADYVAMIKEAYRDRWIDFAQNQGKSTGGFCASPYGKNSFILLSWNERMSDVFTLAHELGHAGHFGACNGSQSIFDTDVSTY